MTPGADDGRNCLNCGQRLAPGAAFCRRCGTRYEEPATPPAPAPPKARRRTALWVAGAIILAGAGAAAAILIASGGSSSSTTVLVGSDGTTAAGSGDVETEAAAETAGGPTEPAADTVEAGRYVQAGSFKTVSHAEEERERLAAAEIDVQVVASDGAEQLYPGFQVLLAGPFEADGQEAATVKALQTNGVPSAFARGLSPAAEISGPAATAGLWSGTLDRSSGEHPSLTGSLPVTLQMNSDGRAGVLEFEDGDCSDDVILSEATATTLSYTQSRPCAASGDILIRPAGDVLMLSLLPSDSDVLVLGKLSPR